MLSQQLHQIFLEERLITSSHRYAITDEQVDSILTPDRIIALLRDELEIEQHLLGRYVLLVQQKAKKIISILVCIGRVSSLRDQFLHRQIWDQHLPLRNQDVPVDFAKSFLYEQMHFVAPLIERGSFSDWSVDVVLPFEIDEPIDDGEGSFGHVHRISIIPQYDRLQETPAEMGKKLFYARKELRVQRTHLAPAAFSREKRVLELLNLLHHPHIIPLLTSFIHGNRFNFIFPLADMDLEKFLNNPGTMPAITHEFLWIQLLGITSAIDSIHNFSYQKDDGLDLEKIGYHHDLKPQNILVKDGTFLLADFGLAHLKDPTTDSGTVDKHGALTYGAPETLAGIHSPARSVGRALDIWSWGCILIEILTVELLGCRELLEFRRFRTTSSALRTDSFFHVASEVKPEVHTWLSILREWTLTHEYEFGLLARQTLDLIQTMLVPDPNQRDSAASLHRKFRKFLNDSQINTGPLRLATAENEIAMKYGGNNEAGIDRKTSAGDVLENLEEILDKEHPVMKALKASLIETDLQ